MIRWMKEEFKYGSLIPIIVFFIIFLFAILAFYLMQDRREAIAVEIGNTIALTGKVNANTEGIEWTSSNVDVATVSKDGIVYGVSPGESEIALKIDDEVINKYRVIVYTYEDTSDENKKYVAVDTVTLNVKNKSIYIGDKFTLKATLSPENATDKKIKWESSDQNIAVVNQNGEVTAIGEGKVEIIAKSTKGITAKATITVAKKENKPTPTNTPGNTNQNINSITIKQGTSKILKVGATKQLTLEFNPKDSATNNIKWKSSSPSIATVDKNGKVTAKKPGYAIILATAPNNKTAGYIIAVRKNVIPELEFEINSNKTYIGGTLQVTAENNTGSPITFESENTKVATIDKNGKITANRSGTSKITIKSDDNVQYTTINVIGSRIHFINIGSSEAGDAILLESNGIFAMVDSAGRSQYNTIRNYLNNLGVNRLEFAIITHPHLDHAGGIENLINNGIKVNTLYTKTYTFNDVAAANGSTSTKKRVEQYINAANSHNTKIVYVDKEVKDESSISLGDMKVYFYNTTQRLVTKDTNQPFNYYTSNYWGGQTENVNSIVNLVRANGRNALLTADLTQYNILSTIVNNVNNMLSNSGQKLDVYKIAHHGYHNCTGNVDFTVNASKYIVTNSIDNRAGDGSYQIANTPVANGKSCFMRMSLDMCDVYYANDATNAIIANMNSSKVTLSGGGYGRNNTNRCE